MSNANDDEREGGGGGSSSGGVNADIPTIDVVDADDARADSPTTTTTTGRTATSSPPPYITTHDVDSHASSSTDGQGHAPVFVSEPPPSGAASSSAHGHAHSQSLSLPPQSILLDVPSPTHRARSGSASVASVTFSVSSRSPSPSPSRNPGDDSSFTSVPPSPTLSNRSTPSATGGLFPTSVALRENRPDAYNQGLNSLGMLHPAADTRAGGGGAAGHMRKASAATISETITLADGEEHEDREPGSPKSGNTHSRRTSMTLAHGGEEGGDGFKKGVVSSKTKELNDGNDARKSSDDKGGSKEDEDEDKGKKIELDDEDESNQDMGPFKKELTPITLAKLLDPKSLESLNALGGIDGVLEGLGTDAKHGLSLPSVKDSHEALVKGGGSSPSSASQYERQRVYGPNVLPVRKSKTLLQLMWAALKDKVLVILSIAAVVSLALGLFQDFGTERETYSCGDGQTCTEAPVDWVEGVAIMVAVAIVVSVGSLNDFQKEKQFKKLNEKKDDRTVKVIRDGAETVINTKELVVGDIALLEPGEVVPCDGIFLSGHNVKCDESGITGESDAIKKLSYAECIKAEREGHELAHTDCFVISGSKILEGVGSYVVVAVGKKSFNGRIMMGLREGDSTTPLQFKLNRLAELIAKLGALAGLILFVALLIRFFVQLGTNNPQRTANEKGLAFVQLLIISVALIVAAVPEGLPLAVTLALAFATKRMTKENLLVRVLGSCETMANASVICTDKTGTLTQNVMTVVAGSVGIHAKFVRLLSENKERTNAGEEPSSDVLSRTQNGERKHPKDFSVDQTELDGVLSPALRRCFNEAICINSTAFEDFEESAEDKRRLKKKFGEEPRKVFVGSKTETALLRFAKENGWENYSKVRNGADVLQMIPFSSQRKAMGVVVRRHDGTARLYLKGASEILTKICTKHVVVGKPGDEMKVDEEAEVETKDIDELSKDNISRTIIFYANQMLRTIALCYKDLGSWPPEGVTDADEVPYEDLAQDLTLIGIVGIEDPLREGVTEAVAQCLKAGVNVKMCTGDNVLTARSIALQCGIFTPGGIIMEGPVFRELNDREMLEVVPRLQVLARSSPTDKQLLVEKLKELGEIVGVTGDGTNDGPALKTADVGFSMGIAGTEVAKEASDIILMDDNFASIVKAIMWGRCVNDAVRKFLQFQISVNVAAVVITFVTAVASASETSALTAVQLLWINIIMDTFAALALATDPATPALLDRKPDKKTAPLFNVDMYKQIVGQSIYQIIVILVFHFAGSAIFNFHDDPNDEAVGIANDDKLNTLVFNAFVFAQIFGSINSRRIDNKKNVFAGIMQNYYFIGITLLECAIQVLIVFVGGSAFSVTRIDGEFWGISLALGFISLPLGFLIRLIPNEPTLRFFYKIRLMSDPSKQVLPTTRPNANDEDWNPALNLLRDTLTTFSSIRGARVRSSSFVVKSRSARLEEAGVKLPSIMTMLPTIVASSVGAGWSPHPNQGLGGGGVKRQATGSLSDPAGSDPSRSSAALWEGKLQLHPETTKDDPAYKKWGSQLASPVKTQTPDMKTSNMPGSVNGEKAV